MNETRAAIRAAVKARHPKPDPSRRRWRDHRSRQAVAAVSASLVVLGALGVWWLRGGVDDLAVKRPNVGYVLPTMERARTDFFLGGLDLNHPGKEVEIIDVEVRTSPNVEYLGAFTVWPRDFPTNKYSVGQGYPPRQLKDRHPALDTVVPAAETAFMPPRRWSQVKPPPLVLNVGFRITSGAVGAVNGVRVTYLLDGQRTHQDFHHAVIACVKPDPCDWPEGADPGENYEDAVLLRFGLIPPR